MPILDNDYPYMDCIRFNDDYAEESISTINRTLEINLSDIKKQYTNYHYKIIMNKKDFQNAFRMGKKLFSFVAHQAEINKN